MFAQLPGECVSVSATKEYGKDVQELQVCVRVRMRVDGCVG
jgi:hypothetical protein